MANLLKYDGETLNVGDTVSVTLKVVEGEKTRRQDFTGVLIAVKGREDNKSFTVRKIGHAGVGVERILPVGSPEIISVKRKSRGKARRSKLYYLRQRTGKRALRVRMGEEKKVEAENEQPKKKAGSRGRTASKKTSTK
jgi:large subunit ribosomal protein L19